MSLKFLKQNYYYFSKLALRKGMPTNDVLINLDEFVVNCLELQE